MTLYNGNIPFETNSQNSLRHDHVTPGPQTEGFHTERVIFIDVLFRPYLGLQYGSYRILKSDVKISYLSTALASPEIQEMITAIRLRSVIYVSNFNKIVQIVSKNDSATVVQIGSWFDRNDCRAYNILGYL